MQARSLIKNAHVISPGLDQKGASIVVSDGKIESVLSDTPSASEISNVFDANDAIVVPGFIDIHTHGAAGHDFCDANPDSLRSIARAKLREGVTSFLPTTLTIKEEDLMESFEAASSYFERPEFAKVPGVHVEGPFINPKCVGAQNPKHVRPPNSEEIARLQSILPIKIVSLAVEMPGGMDLVKSLTEQGIIASLAHTAASFSQFSEAKAAGATHLTHFCNQMTPLHHREIGLVGAGLLDDSIRIEMICDGIHLSPDMIRLAFKVVDLDRIMLITDSIAASGLGNNQRTQLGELEVIVQDGVARLESGALAGSTLKMNVALKNIRDFTQKPLSEIIRTTALNQAEALQLPTLSRIEPGYAADLVVLDDEFNPTAVFVDGVERLHELDRNE